MRLRAHERLLVLLAAAAPLSGCVADGALHRTARGHCKEDRVQLLIGRLATVELAAEALRLSGAREIRWNPWGTIVTTAYRHGRLNLDLDQENRVTGVSCG